MQMRNRYQALANFCARKMKEKAYRRCYCVRVEPTGTSYVSQTYDDPCVLGTLDKSNTHVRFFLSKKDADKTRTAFKRKYPDCIAVVIPSEEALQQCQEHAQSIATLFDKMYEADVKRLALGKPSRT